jgi:histidyl-tRNA synthetase
VALRFDLTVPFARYVCQHQSELGLPFKRWAIGNVFRGENPQAGRYREFTQCDFDVAGVSSTAADAEIVQVICASMRKLQVPDFEVRINNRRLMNGLAAALGFADRAAEVLQLIDKIAKIGEEKVAELLQKEANLSQEQVEKLMAFVSLSKDKAPDPVLAAVEQFTPMNSQMREGINELRDLVEILEAARVPSHEFSIDFSIARGLGYYTGIVYETTIRGLPQIGSVCSGGRYDNLTMTFQEKPISGVGASVGIDRLLAAFEELGQAATIRTPCQALILVPTPESVPGAHGLAARLRALGLDIEVYPESAKMKRQVQYASRSGHAWLLHQSNRADEFILENVKTHEKSTVETSDAALIELVRRIKGQAN